MRKLASIVTIDQIETHDQSDHLEIAHVLGWQIIVRKGEVQVNQKAVYCEIDSIISTEYDWVPEAVKERAKNGKMRIKTIKLRGKISQGLIVPLSNSIENFQEKEIGEDVTELLHIKKYKNISIPSQSRNLGNRKKGTFPCHLISKTDEPRIQSHPWILKSMKGEDYYATLKMDGSSATYLRYEDIFMICSRNYIIDHESDTIWNKINLKYDINKILPEGFAVQGEICGPAIQKNLSNLKDYDFFVFNVYNITLKKRLNLEDMIYFCEKYHFQTVPIEERGIFQYESITELLEKAKGFYPKTQHHREGLVYRTIEQSYSFKIINNDYLLKYD